MDLCEVFWALGDPIRFRIVKALVDSPLHVSELVARLGVPQPNVSRHLKALRDRGVIRSTRNGKWVEYSLDREAFSTVSRWASGLGGGPTRESGEGEFETEGAAKDESVLFCE